MTHATFSSTFIATVLAIGTVATPARADQFKVGPASTFEFTAKITGSSFVAKTKAVSGKVEVDMATGEIKKGVIIIKAGSFKTGMGMRDKHMTDKYLKAGKFPTIRRTSSLTSGERAIESPVRTSRASVRLSLGHALRAVTCTCSRRPSWVTRPR